jgi:hypothetical protein
MTMDGIHVPSRTQRGLLAAAVAVFAWWATYGAPAWFSARSYDDAATWVEALSLPWLWLGLAAGAVAMWHPNRWTVGAFAGTWAIHGALVFLTW